jgi:hypothetical protein
MRKLVAHSFDAKISGRLVMAFTQSLYRHEIQPILEKYDLEPTDPEAWYPQQHLLNVFRDIEDGNTNVSQNLIAIGMKGAETAAYPPDVHSVEAALKALPRIHEMNHRNIPNVGREYVIKIMGERHVQITNRSPYPNDVLYGFVWGIVKWFHVKTGQFQICVLDREAEDATFDITWSE